MNASTRTAFVALAVAAVLLGGLPGTALAQSSGNYSVALTGVDVSPSEPVPGERVTLTATVQNVETSSATVDLDSIYVRRADGSGFEELVRVRDVGAITPGSSLSVPLSVKFEDAGTKRLRVTANVVDDSGDRTRVTYPVVVDVDDTHPQVDVETNESVVGLTSDGAVRVANGLSTDARNVEVRLSGTGVDFVDDRSVRSSVAAGESVRVPFRYEPQVAGQQEVVATLSYSVAGSGTRTVSETVPIDVDRRRRNVVVQASQAGPASETLSVTVSNRGNVPVENLTVDGAVDGGAVTSSFVGTLGPQRRTTTRVNVTVPGDSATATVRANYEYSDGAAVATDSLTVTAAPADIDLTGLAVRREGGVVRVEGSAANVGASGTESVVVSVRDTASASPAAPSGEYFVGSVPASDFVSFEVTARTTGNASTLPLEVRYRTDDGRVTETVDVPLSTDVAGDDPAGGGRTGGNTGGSGSSTPVVVLATLIVVGIGAVMVYAWRRSRGSP